MVAVLIVALIGVFVVTVMLFDRIIPEADQPDDEISPETIRSLRHISGTRID